MPVLLRGPAVVAGLATLVMTASGCAFLDDLADPREPPSTAAGTSSASPPAALPTRGPQEPVLVAQATLQRADGRFAGTVQLAVGPVVTGLVLPFHRFSEDCPVEGPSLQYVPVIVTFDLTTAPTDGLAGHLTVTPGPGTPADVAGAGVFFEPGTTDEPYCQGYPPFPDRDTFWSIGSGDRVTGYVVLDHAVTAVAPDGRAEVFPTLQARLDTLRARDHGGSDRPLDVAHVSVGASCPDDPGALCVALGG